jgi:cyclophilin family peptidyl-prolyl cis-trans isomerase
VTEEFNLHVAVGTVVRFESSQGTFDVELFDDDAPQTVANFLNYSARYADSIAHRSAVTTIGSPFVIQGGGFSLDSSDQLQMIATDAPVMSEAAVARSNVRGTLSMALGSDLFGMTDPDSGTSQWFVNLRDNSMLNAQGFTVYGTVIGDGMEVLDAIAALDRVDVNDVVPLATAALGEVPLDGYMLQEVQLTGTVSVASNSIQVNGTGTLFTTELEIDDVIVIEGNLYRIVQIINDSQLLVDASQATPIVDAPYHTVPIATTIPTRDQYVVFSSIGAVL